VLVTGAGGSIGHHLVHLLKKGGYWSIKLEQGLAITYNLIEPEVRKSPKYVSQMASQLAPELTAVGWPQTVHPLPVVS
jgi:nucleoside-diphosphate-sugar epimerase